MAKPSIAKQLLGAVIGGAVGLTVYYGYEAITPHLTAWTSIPQRWLTNPSSQPTTIADTDRDPDQQERFEARAQEIADKFGANYQKYQVEGEQRDTVEVTEDYSAAEALSGETTRASVPVPTWIDPESNDEQGHSSVEASVTKSGAPALPDSGFGAVATIVGALVSTVGLRLRRRLQS